MKSDDPEKSQSEIRTDDPKKKQSKIKSADPEKNLKMRKMEAASIRVLWCGFPSLLWQRQPERETGH